MKPSVFQGRRLSQLLAPVAAAGLAALPAAAAPASTSPEQGYDLGEIPTPRGLAMGGAQTAIGASTVAIFQNPANLPVSRVYHFESLAAISPEAGRQTYGGAVADSVTSRLAGGFGGTWSMLDPDGLRRSWTDLRLTLAYPLGDKFSVGATGRYLRAEQAIAAGPLGASLASDGTRDAPAFNAFTFDVGATVAPVSGLRIGAAGHNLTSPGTSFAPTTAVGGIGYTSQAFSLEGDVLADFTTWTKTKVRAMAGAEVFLAGRFALRAGYRYDDGMRTHAVSAGAGYIDRKWSIEIGGRRDVVAESPSTFVGLGVRYFHDSGPTPADEPDSF